MTDTIQSSRSTTPTHRACNEFTPHLFLPDRCRDCSLPASAHNTVHTLDNNISTTPRSYDVNKARELLYSNRQCTHFRPHYWVWNRCIDCAQCEGVHLTSDGQAKHLNNPYQSWIEYKQMKPVDLTQYNSIEQCELKLQQLNNELKSIHDDYNQLHKLQDQLLNDDKTITQHEYDGRILALNEIHNKKQIDIQSQITAIQEHIQLLIQKQQEDKEKQHQIDTTTTIDTIDTSKPIIEEEAKVNNDNEPTASEQAIESEPVIETAAIDEQAKAAEEQQQETVVESQEQQPLEPVITEDKHIEEEKKTNDNNDVYAHVVVDTNTNELTVVETVPTPKHTPKHDDYDAHHIVSQLIDSIVTQAVTSHHNEQVDDNSLHQQTNQFSPALTIHSESDYDSMYQTPGHTPTNSTEQQSESDYHITVTDISIAELSNKQSFITRVERMIQNGRHVIRYTHNNTHGQIISLFIRQLPHNKVYTLHWSNYNERVVTAQQTISFDTVKYIALGNQSTVHQLSRPINNLVIDNNERINSSFSIISNTHSLHLQVGYQRERDILAYGLYQLIKLVNPDIKVLQLGQYKDNKEQINIEKQYERNELQFSTSKTDVTIPVYQQLTNQAITQQYTITVKVNISGVDSISKHHNYIVCLIGRNNKTDQSVYISQTEIIKNEGSFNTQLLIQYDINQRAGWYHKYRLNLYDIPSDVTHIEDQYRIGTTILEQQHIVNNVNTELNLQLHHRDPAKNNLLHNTRLNITIVDKQQITYQPPFKWPPRIVDKFMDVLSYGTGVTLYTDNNKSHNVTLFYRVNKSLDSSYIPDVGILYYVPVGHVLSEEKRWSLPLNRITHIYRGKYSDHFPKYLDDSLCISLVVDNGKRLDFVCHNIQQRDLWVGGVANILNAARSYKKRIPL